MNKHLALLSIPAIRPCDLPKLPALQALASKGAVMPLTPSFPAVTCSVQATMTTGAPPKEHGIIANGLYDRESGRVNMWTSPNTAIGRPQIWQTLKETHGEAFTSAAWFPLQCKQTQADYACTPAPIHNPDGSESLWCYTKPTEYYGDLRDQFGHFPLQNYWGPMTSPAASNWIVDSAIDAARRWRPNLFYIYIPHLDYEPQRHGPDSPQFDQALAEMNEMLGRLIDGFGDAYGPDLEWLVAGEYAITPVSKVVYPNRVLREAGLLNIAEQEDGEHLVPGESAAWALCDHQIAHVFVTDESQVERIAAMLGGQDGVAEVLTGDARGRYAIDHPRCGDVVLVAEPDSWFAYYYWLDDARAPAFAHKVDIHRKPGYDPVELFIDRETMRIPLDATLVKGSHGAPAVDESQKTVLLSSCADRLAGLDSATDLDVYKIVREFFL